MEKLM